MIRVEPVENLWKKIIGEICDEFFFSFALPYRTCYWLAKNLIHPIIIFKTRPLALYCHFERKLQFRRLLVASHNHAIGSIIRLLLMKMPDLQKSLNNGL
jgi:hypothetical protein